MFRLERLTVQPIERLPVLDIDSPRGLLAHSRLHIVADLALDADICRQAITGFDVDSGHVAGVRVAVGIAVFHIEQDHKFVPVFDCFRHDVSPPFPFLFLLSRTAAAVHDNSPRRTRTAPPGSAVREVSHSAFPPAQSAAFHS